MQAAALVLQPARGSGRMRCFNALQDGLSLFKRQSRLAISSSSVLPGRKVARSGEGSMELKTRCAAACVPVARLDRHADTRLLVTDGPLRFRRQNVSFHSV